MSSRLSNDYYYIKKRIHLPYFLNIVLCIFFYFPTGCMYFVNCVCNPFLYSLLSQRFRLGFHILLTNAFSCNKIVVQSFMNFSNGYSRSPQHYQPGSQGVRRSLPNAIVVYQNGEATMSWTKMSKLSREPTVRTTDVWTKMWFSRINLLKKYVLTKKIYHHIHI